jgi:hypothetical protein
MEKRSENTHIAEMMFGIVHMPFIYFIMEKSGKTALPTSFRKKSPTSKNVLKCNSRHWSNSFNTNGRLPLFRKSHIASIFVNKFNLGRN